MKVIGLMSGTSYDAIDAAAADLELDDGTVSLRPLGAVAVPYDAAMRARIAEGLPPAATSYEQVCRLDTELGQRFGEAAAQALRELCDGHADLVVSHGQTMYHWVDPSGRARGTLQVGEPTWIAARTGVPVVSNLRSRDITVGGQGAPLVSMFDVLLLGDGEGRRAALNLGGIANLTIIGDAGHAVAFDAGPGNALVDATVRELCGEPFDADGRRAARGVVDEGLLADLLDDPYYRQPPPKSTGKELFHWAYVRERLDRHAPTAADDVVATVTELTARVVAEEVRRHRVDELFASGGGTRNRELMARLTRLVADRCRVRDIAELGVGSDEKEAYAFALLGFLTVHGLGATIPSCTGAAAPSVLGSITPGAAPLRLPEPPGRPPERLVIAPPG